MDPSAAKLLTPSLLDLENMDLSVMLVHSPYMLSLGASTPTSSERSHSDSGSSDLSYFPPQDDMTFQSAEEALEQFFLPATSTDYYSASSSMAPQQMFYSSAESYSTYGQQQWQSLPMFGHPPVSSSVEEMPPSAFSSLDMPAYGSGGSFIPPTPQSPFPFQAASPQQQESYLSPPPGLQSNARPVYSHSRSASSLSRSCTPNLDPTQASSAPSNYSLGSNADSASASSSLLAYGVPVPQPGMGAPQTWRCAYPGCTSRAMFTRGCDLRKHFNRHSKHLFCRVDGCPQSEACAVADSSGRRGSLSGGGGFSSKKDRARHEAKHNPGIRCEWRGSEGEECGRVFSRMDNMKDHVRRIHRKGSR